ncbi:MAG: aminoglycoside phosphotransferase family protein [Dehalococcoidia bacterium]
MMADTKLNPFAGLAAPSRAKMDDFAREHVVPTLWPSATLTRLRQRYSTLEPTGEHMVLYAVELEGSEQATFVTLRFGELDQLERIFEAHYAGPANGARRPRPVLLAEAGCLVEPFPYDWKMPGLRSAADPESVRPLLEAVGVATSTAFAIEALRFRPGKRCVLAYHVDEGTTVIGKALERKATAERLASILSQAQPQGEALGVRIPRLLALHREIGLVVMERLDAHDLSVELRTRPQRENQDLVERAARGLAGFHRLQLDVGGDRQLSDELAEVRGKLESIGTEAPLLAPPANQILDDAERRLGELPSPAPKVVHGGYKPSQAFIMGDHVGVVDLEGTCLGDPAIDVGNFLAVLHRDAALQDDDRLRRLAASFLSAYARASGDVTIVQRARVLQSIELVRIVARKYERSPSRYLHEGSRWAPLRLLDEAARCLEAA